MAKQMSSSLMVDKIIISTVQSTRPSNRFFSELSVTGHVGVGKIIIKVVEFSGWMTIHKLRKNKLV